MLEYQYTVRYIKGKKNVVAESLSRPIIVIHSSSEAMWLGKSREKVGKFLLHCATSWVICQRETGGEGIIGEGNRAQETGNNPRLIPGTHSLLVGQGVGVSEKLPNFFRSARESNPGSLGWEPSVLPLHHEAPRKSREEIRALQREEERWKDLMDYLEGGKVPNKKYQRTTLDQFTLWEGLLHYSISKKDGSIHFCLVVPQSLKKSALHHAHTKSGHLGQRKILAMAEDLFYWPNLGMLSVNM